MFISVWSQNRFMARLSAILAHCALQHPTREPPPARPRVKRSATATAAGRPPLAPKPLPTPLHRQAHIRNMALVVCGRLFAYPQPTTQPDQPLHGAPVWDRLGTHRGISTFLQDPSGSRRCGTVLVRLLALLLDSPRRGAVARDRFGTCCCTTH